VEGNSLLRYVSDLIGERHPVTAPAALDRTAECIADGFGRIGLDVVRDGFRAFGRTHHNIIATRPGRVQDAPPLIIAAHYDAVAGSPGADDNASGVAAILEAARRLSRLSLNHPVQFIAFGLEEENLIGSRAYVSRLMREKRPIHGAIVLECVGFTDFRDGSQRKPAGLPIAIPTTGNFLGVIGNTASAELLQGFTAAARKQAPDLPLVPLIVPGRGEALPDTRRSDHAAFWDAGLPALMLTDTADFRNPNYHSPTDTLETLDLGFLTHVARSVAAAAIELDLPR
jgi:hypothetical protein